MRYFVLLVFVLLFCVVLSAQNPYTQDLYNVENISDVNYGTATNYAGSSETLLMDIYKPVGDDNCLRPLMILAHGGAWVTDDKTNTSLEYMSMELAKRGWVVANINYRLGMNNTDDYSTNAFCQGITEPCAFMIDSMEVERANFRAMQDAKGAIRFMKSRNMTDSTDIENVFMAGESAGGFISLSTGFTDDISKKPASCFAIGDVLSPDADFDD
ncbi:MAG: alpha/beta hydrolase, partial [Saprospiraceae bacterium]